MRLQQRFGKFVGGLICLAVLAGTMVAPLAVAEEEGGPKHSIKEVMKLAHKDGLLKKVLGGEASDDDKKMLLDLYVSMLEGKPKKGDMASWQTLAGKSALAAAKVVVGREGALKELEAATNCKACHSVHK